MEHCAWRLGAVGLAIVVAGCASPPAPPRHVSQATPAALQPPPGEVLSHVLLADGVQIYECRPAKERAGAYDWTFQAPEAVLTDEGGRPIGKHYAGPTWEALDGSRVVGKVMARADAPDPQAIPWLLLGAEPAGGGGAFSGVRSIQRLQTAGGKAPAGDCDAGDAARTARVPYRAVYRFYKAVP
jgi:hypothetical protein